jgi:hypothetical protein
LEFFLAPQEHLIFQKKIDAFSFGANKEDLFFLSDHIISLLPIGRNSFVSRLLQHVMLLTYEHVLCNYTLCEYVGIIQKNVTERIDVNAKHKNGKMHVETTIMESFQYY